MTPATRQRSIDAERCFNADDLSSRPDCTLTAVVRYGAIALCATCHPRRSTVGKGTASVALPAATSLDVLDWVSAAQDQAVAAQRTLTASVSRARHAGHSWSTIGTRLGITKQAAQQRFGAPADAHGRAQSPRPHDKEVTAD